MIMHGFAHGRLERHDDMPEAWRVGIFAHERFHAWMRFSSDTGPTDPDLGRMCGIGLKLFGVSGENALGDCAIGRCWADTPFWQRRGG